MASPAPAPPCRRGCRANRGLSEVVKRLQDMAMNFLACDREQAFLMPPDPRDWLPEGHLAWFVLASVEEMDLAAFYGSYRRDGWGRAAFEPSMMVALLMYAYARVSGPRGGSSGAVWRMSPIV